MISNRNVSSSPKIIYVRLLLADYCHSIYQSRWQLLLAICICHVKEAIYREKDRHLNFLCLRLLTDVAAYGRSLPIVLDGQGAAASLAARAPDSSVGRATNFNCCKVLSCIGGIVDNPDHVFAIRRIGTASTKFLKEFVPDVRRCISSDQLGKGANGV